VVSKLGCTFLATAALAVAAALSTVSPVSAAPAGDPAPAVSRAAAPPHGIPKKNCRTGFGYAQQGTFLCMTGQRGPASFANAMLDCMDLAGRVADYHDWRYRTFRGDGAQAPVGWWLGGITADNTALFVNQANAADFDGETSRFDSRPYACAHDLLR
jgi:hypothetical protein